MFTASAEFNIDIPDLSKTPSKQLGEFIVRTFLDRWENRRGTADMPAPLRVSVTHPDGREKAIAIFDQQVRPALAKVLKPKNRATASALIATQLVGVAFLRYVLKLPIVAALGKEELVRHVGQTIQRYIEEETNGTTRQSRTTSRHRKSRSTR